MVLEALAAISLAGNIVQFIDCTCKLFNGTIKIYRSRVGATNETQDIEDATQRLQHLCSNLSSNSPTTVNNTSMAQNEATIQQLARECEVAAREILTALESIKAQDPTSKWDSFRAALATVWKEPQILAMQRRLDSYRLQLVLQMQTIMRYVLSVFM